MAELWKKVIEENAKNALGRQGANATTLEQRYGKLKAAFKAVNAQLLLQIQSTGHVLSDLIPFASASGDLKTGLTMDLNGRPFIASVWHASNKLKTGVVQFNYKEQYEVGMNKLFDHYFDQKIAWKAPTEVHQPARMMMAQMTANKASAVKEGEVAKQYTPIILGGGRGRGRSGGHGRGLLGGRILTEEQQYQADYQAYELRMDMAENGIPSDKEILFNAEGEAVRDADGNTVEVQIDVEKEKTPAVKDRRRNTAQKTEEANTFGKDMQMHDETREKQQTKQNQVDALRLKIGNAKSDKKKRKWTLELDVLTGLKPPGAAESSPDE